MHLVKSRAGLAAAALAYDWFVTNAIDRECTAGASFHKRSLPQWVVALIKRLP
jgi:hypothetical protein